MSPHDDVAPERNRRRRAKIQQHPLAARLMETELRAAAGWVASTVSGGTDRGAGENLDRTSAPGRWPAPARLACAMGQPKAREGHMRVPRPLVDTDPRPRRGRCWAAGRSHRRLPSPPGGPVDPTWGVARQKPPAPCRHRDFPAVRFCSGRAQITLRAVSYNRCAQNAKP